MGGKLEVRRYFTFGMARWKLCASTTFKISHFQPVHCPTKNSISPKVFNRIPKIFLQLKDVEGGYLGGYFQVRKYFTFAMARWKLCPTKTFEISHFQPVHCPSKNPISPKLINRFSKTLLQLEVVEGGHAGGKLQVHRYFSFATARWKLWTSKTSKISLVQPLHCPSRNPISPKLPNRFSKTLLQFDVVEGVHMSGKLQVHRYLTFAMTRWKLCAWTPFEISHFEPAHCPSKNPISPKVFNRIWKTLLQLEVVEGGLMGGKLQVRRYFTFAMTRPKLCASTPFEISHFQPVHCPSKNPISPKVFNRISKTLLQLEVVEGGLMGGKLQVRRYFTFAMTRRKLCAWTPFEISHFQPVHGTSKNPISPNLIDRFSKTLLQLEIVEGGHMGAYFQVRRYFIFCDGKVKTLRNENIWNFPLSTCTLYQQKPWISKVTKPIFENFASVRRCWRWAYEWKVAGAQVFYFSNHKVKSKADIWVDIFRCAGILLLQWQVKSLHIDNIWNIPLSTCTLSQQKSYISKGIQPNFENFASARSCWRWAYGWKAAGAQVFYFCNDQAKTLRMDTIWNFPLSTCTLSQQKPYISKVNQPIFEDFASARSCWRWAYGCIFSGAQVFYLLRWQGENFAQRKHLKFPTFNLYTVPAKTLDLQSYPTDFRKLCFSSTLLKVGIWVESCRCTGILLFQSQGEKQGRHLGGYFQVRRYFTFAMARWKLCPTKTFEISHFQPVHCPSKNPISPKLSFAANMLRVGIWAERFKCGGILVFQWEGENFCPSKNCAISHFELVHCPSKSSLSPKVLNRLSKTFLHLKDVDGGYLAETFKSAVILVCNGKVKTFPHRQIVKFPTFNLYTVPAKML